MTRQDWLFLAFMTVWFGGLGAVIIHHDATTERPAAPCQVTP